MYPINLDLNGQSCLVLGGGSVAGGMMMGRGIGLGLALGGLMLAMLLTLALSLRFVAPALLRALIERGVGVETMDTAAACRTYNVLVSEGRRAVAALIIG